MQFFQFSFWIKKKWNAACVTHSTILPACSQNVFWNRISFKRKIIPLRIIVSNVHKRRILLLHQPLRQQTQILSNLDYPEVTEDSLVLTQFHGRIKEILPMVAVDHYRITLKHQMFVIPKPKTIWKWIWFYYFLDVNRKRMKLNRWHYERNPVTVVNRVLESHGINSKINDVDPAMLHGYAMMMMLMIMRKYLDRRGQEVDRVVGDQLGNFIFVNRCVYRKPIAQCYRIKHVKRVLFDISAPKWLLTPIAPTYIIHIPNRMYRSLAK